MKVGGSGANRSSDKDEKLRRKTEEWMNARHGGDRKPYFGS